MFIEYLSLCDKLKIIREMLSNEWESIVDYAYERIIIINIQIENQKRQILIIIRNQSLKSSYDISDYLNRFLDN